MRNTILFTVFTLILGFTFFTAAATEISAAQVANYSTGKYGQANYEHFSFWTNDSGKAGEIQYRYGKDSAELNLTYIGVSSFKGMNGFDVKFPDGKVYFVGLNSNKTIKVVDKNGKYNKTFRWEYEGPVDGKGTFCQPCAEDADAAYNLLKTFYL